MDSTEQSSIPDNIFDSLPNEQSTIPDNVFDHLPETRFTPVPAPKITGAIPIYGQAQEQPAYSFTPLLGNEGQAAIAPTRELPLPPPADWETNQNIATGMAAGAGQVLVGAGSELGKTAVYALHSLPIPTERADTPEFKQWAYEENRRRSALSPGQKMKEVRKDSVFQAATQAEEWAKENLPVSRKNQQFTVLSHTPFEFHPVGAAESAAGLIPMVASGPLAPVTIGLQSFGSHLGNDFDNLKSQGMSDDDAAKVTVDRALLSGAAGATIFALLPKPLHAAGDKYLIEKFGETALKRFIAARAAGAIEGAVLMPSAHVAENIISGRPATEGLVDSAVGGAVLVGLSPRGKSEAEQAFLGKPGYKFDEDAKARALATPVPIRLSDEAAAIARGRRAQPTYAEPITQDGSTPTVLRGATQEQSGGAETRNEAAPINPEVPIEPGPLGEFPAIQPVVTRGGKRYEKRGAVWHALDEPGEPVVVRADDTTKKLVSDLEAKLAGEKPKTGGGLLQVTIGEPITTQQANQIAQRIRYAVGGVRILDAEGQPVDISALTQGARTKFEAGEPHSKPGIIAALKALGVVVNDEGAAKKESPVAVVSEPEKPAGAPVPPPVTEVVPPAPVKPEIVAKEIGFTVKPTYSTEGLTPEQVATAAKTNPQRLNFTDERPPGESPTSGLTFTVPVGATREEVLAQLEKSKQGYTPPKPKAVEPVVPKVEPPPAKPEAEAGKFETAGQKLAAKLRAAKSGVAGGKNLNALGIIPKIWDDALEVAAVTVEKLGETADGIAAAISGALDYLRKNHPAGYDESAARAELRGLFGLPAEVAPAPEKGFLAQKLAEGKPETSQSKIEEQRKIADEVSKRSTEESAPTLPAATDPAYQAGAWFDRAIEKARRSGELGESALNNLKDAIARLKRVWPSLETADIRGITRDHVRGWMDAMAERASRQTQVGKLTDEPAVNHDQVKRMVRVLRDTFNLRELSGQVQDATAGLKLRDVGLKAPRTLSSQLTTPTPGQSQMILDGLTGRFRDLGEAMFHTGVRIGEILKAFNKPKDDPAYAGLRWSELNLTNGTMDLRRKRTKVKSLGAAQRIVPLTPEAIQFFKDLKQRNPPASEGDEIFGGIADHQNTQFNAAVRKAALEAGIDTGNDVTSQQAKAIRGDIFRKMFATRMQSSMSAKDVASLLGNTEDVVKKWYSLLPSMSELASKVAKVPAAIGKKVEPVATFGSVEKKDGSGRTFYRVSQPVSELKIIPNFKKNADAETGVVPGKQLAGPYNEAGLAPVLVWERTDGSRWLITGRHRVDLARREGIGNVTADVYREKDGFTEAMATVADAESNIHDNQGTIYDYGFYFRKSAGYPEAEAKRRGLFRNPLARDAFTIARDASDATFDQWYGTDGTAFDDKQALAIVTAAPQNEAAQSLGRKLAIKGKSASEIFNLVRRASSESPKMVNDDMFGGTAEFKDMEAEEAAAEAMRKELKAELNQRTLKTFLKGGDIEKLSPEQAAAKVATLKGKLAQLDGEWWLGDKPIAKEVRRRAGTLPPDVSLSLRRVKKNLSDQKRFADYSERVRNGETLSQDEQADFDQLSGVGVVGDLLSGKEDNASAFTGKARQLRNAADEWDRQATLARERYDRMGYMAPGSEVHRNAYDEASRNAGELRSRAEEYDRKAGVYQRPKEVTPEIPTPPKKVSAQGDLFLSRPIEPRQNQPNRQYEPASPNSKRNHATNELLLDLAAMFHLGPSEARALKKSVREVTPELEMDEGANSRRLAMAALRAIERTFGNNLLFLDFGNSELGSRIDAVVTGSVPDTVFVNVRTSRTMTSLVGHELLHSLRNKHGDLYLELFEKLLPLVKSGEFKEFESAIRASYKTQGASITDQRVGEELIAELFHDSFQDKRFWDKMAAKEPSLFVRLANTVLEYLNKLIGQLRSDDSYRYFTDIGKAHDAIADALAEYSKRQGGEGKPDRSGNASLSLARDQEPRHQVAGVKDLGEEYTPESINDSLGRIRSNPRFDFSSPTAAVPETPAGPFSRRVTPGRAANEGVEVNPANTERAIRLISDLSDPTRSQGVLSELKFTAPGEMSGSLLVGDVLDYATRLIRDTGDQSLFELMRRNAADIAKDYGGTTSTKAGRVLRGDMWASRRTLWKNAVEIFKEYEDKALTKLFGAEKGREIAGFIRDALRNGPVTDPTEINKIVDERLERYGVTPEIKTALRILDAYERSQTEWLKPDVKNDIKEIIKASIGETLRYKQANEADGGKDFRTRLSDRLFERTKRSIDEANLKIEKENEALAEDKQKPLISDSPEALDTLRRQMDDLSYEVWKDKGQRETSTTAKAWEKERGFEDATAQRLIDQWTRDQTEWLKDARKSKVSESIKEFLKSGGMTEEQLRVKLIADGARELTARELAFQAVKRKATLDANRKQASIDSEASRISGLAQKTAEQILEGMETRLPSGAEWLKPDEKNAVREIVKQALQTKPSAKDVESMGELEASRKVAPITDAFSTELVDKLKAAGVSEDIAMRLAQEVANTRQAQWASARVRAMERASKSGRVSTLMDEILAAPYLLQQKPEWREQVARRWFELNGLDKPGAIEATKLFQSAFQDALNKATEELVKRLAARADPQAQNVEEFINALRAGLLDASKPWSSGFAEKAGWSLPNADQMRKLADLDLKLENKDLTLIERNELVEEMMGIYLKLRPPPSLAKILAGNLIATNLTGIRTVTINIGGPSLYLLFDRAMHTLAAPHEIGRIWSPVFEAFRGFLKEARYSMSTDAYTVVNNAFGPASDQLRRLWETGLEDVRSDSYARRAKGAVKMIFGGQQFFMRLLNSLDQASSVVIREASLTYYGGEVFKRAGMGTKDIADMVQLTHNLKSALYHEALENGMDPVRARVHSDARANEILPSMISERLSLPTAEGGAGMDEIAAIREARKAAEAAEADAYSSVGRLMPGVSETDEGGFLSRNAFIHSLLRVSSNLRRSDAQDRILAVSLLGYLNIPIRTARFYAWNSPYGLIRLAYHHARKARMGADWDNQWKQSLANEHQEWYRLQNALASTFVMTALTATGLAFWGASAYSDDKSRKNGIFITGSGPANANALDEWKKVGFRQNSIIIFMGGHPAAIPLSRLGEPMSHLFSILAARDDYNWRKKEAEVSKRPFKETWTKSVGYGLGTYAGMLGQRGIISNVARWGRAFGSEGGAQAALASTIGGVAAGVTMPYLGLQRSIRDMVMGKVDTTSVSAAIMANFPVLGAFQNGAVNRFGDPLGDQSWYGKIADTGVPIAFQVADNPKNRALYTALVEKGITPPVLRRAVVEEKYGPLTDTEWNKLATRSGALLKAQTLDNLGSIEKMPSADGKKLLSSLASASDRTAALGLGLQVVTTSAGSASGGSASVSGAGAGGLLAGGGLLASNRGLTAPSGLLGGGGGGSGGSGSSGGRVSTRGSRVSRSRGRLGLRGGARRLSLRRGTRRSLISGRNRIAGRMRRPGMRMRRLSLA